MPPCVRNRSDWGYFVECKIVDGTKSVGLDCTEGVARWLAASTQRRAGPLTKLQTHAIVVERLEISVRSVAARELSRSPASAGAARASGEIHGNAVTDTVSREISTTENHADWTLPPTSCALPAADVFSRNIAFALDLVVSPRSLGGAHDEHCTARAVIAICRSMPPRRCHRW